MKVKDFEEIMNKLRQHRRQCFVAEVFDCLTCSAYQLLTQVQAQQLSALELPLMAALIQKLGGEVVLTDEELMSVHGTVLYDHSMEASRTKLSIRPPEEAKNHTGEGSAS
jgi:hypothetical protein